MNFLEIKAVKTSQEGIFYNPNFRYSDVFPEDHKREQERIKVLQKANPTGKRDPAEVMLEVGMEWFQEITPKEEKAKLLLRHAFCREDGSAIEFAEGEPLGDYIVEKTLDLYAEVIGGTYDEGKQSSETATVNT